MPAATLSPPSHDSRRLTSTRSTRNQPQTMPAAMVNRKKQKRRAKQAARLGPSDQDIIQNGYNPADAAKLGDIDDDLPTTTAGGTELYDDAEDAQLDANHHHHDNDDDDDDDMPSSEFNYQNGGHQSLDDSHNRSAVAKKKVVTTSTMTTTASHPPVPSRLASRVSHLSAQKLTKTRSIWNTTTQEERENIKSFWHELGDDERRQLVKVEKDAVLKKMKEQQKHSCSCTVCGRKRTAIEEELEVLYDAYYDELEQYADHSLPPPQLRQPLPSPPSASSAGQYVHHHHSHTQFRCSRGHVHDAAEGDDTYDDEYDEEIERDEPYSDDSQDDSIPSGRADFFAFGNSLTVKG